MYLFCFSVLRLKLERRWYAPRLRNLLLLSKSRCCLYRLRELKTPGNKVQPSFRRDTPLHCASERRLLFPDGGFQPPVKFSNEIWTVTIYSAVLRRFRQEVYCRRVRVQGYAMKNFFVGLLFVCLFALVGIFIGRTPTSAIGCGVIAFFVYLFYRIVTSDKAMEKHWQRLGYRVALVPPLETEESPRESVLIYTEGENELRFIGTIPYDIAQIFFPSETEWRETMPPWAQGRRKEILARLRDYQQNFRYYINCPAEGAVRR